ncbi:uncharacterized protein LOC119092935 [Pollicipes pollicipes]|uniref:uncharacterized protein LOC119092935 n=1 Tax=Pollicipes pollicipes TaxID=41117 RepID=UPI001884C0B8|nr:uncharacterized protein LOC119092935 [Pollicipes pollicipes]
MLAAAALLLLAAPIVAAPPNLWAAARAHAQLVTIIDASLASLNLWRSEMHKCPPVIGELAECSCDEECALYGDCCLNVSPQALPRNDLACRRSPDFGYVYMVSRCPVQWRDTSVRSLCARNAAFAEDPFAALPVTSPASGMTYSNYYCAICHGDLAGSVFWTPAISCPTLTKEHQDALNITDTFIEENLLQNPAGEWGLQLMDENNGTFHACVISLHSGNNDKEHLMRNCQPKISSCAANWTNLELALMCTAYNAYMYHGRIRYRNAHCALCNYVPQQYITYWPATNNFAEGRRPRMHSSVFFLDITTRSGMNAVGAARICTGARLWDPFFKICREVSVSSGVTNATGSLTCPKVTVNEYQFQVSDKDVAYVLAYDLFLDRGYYELSDGQLTFCDPRFQLKRFQTAFSYALVACRTASVLCLLLHLAAFCAVPETRNLPGKCVTSLCVCLLIGYLCSMAALWQDYGTDGCVLLAIVNFSAFAAALFWVNVMAIDVFNTLR